MKRTLAILVLLLATSTCTSDSSRVSGPGPTTSPDERRRKEATEWFLREISKDGHTISFVYTMSGVASGCQRQGEPVITESDEKVVVIAYKSVLVDRNRPCTEELGYIEAVVNLKEPLGHRALVGCRPGKLEPSEDKVCLDLERSRDHGVFDVEPQD